MRYRITAMVLLLLSTPLQAEELEARLEWARRVELATLVSGVVIEVHGEPGMRVAKGSPLVRLDPRRFEARLRAAEAAKVHAGHRFAEAERERSRAEELYDRTVLSNHELERALADHAEAEAQLRSAELQVAEAEFGLEQSVARAPFEGWVVTRRVEVGSAVNGTQQPQLLMEVAEAGRMRVRAALPSQFVTTLKPGGVVTVSAGERRFNGRIVAVAPAQGGGYELIAEFESGTARLAPGGAVRLALP